MNTALTAAEIWGGAVLLCLAAWPVRRHAWAVAAVALAVFALPALQPMTPAGWKAAVVLAVGAFLPPKLADLATSPPPTFREWVRFLLHPATLVYRRYGDESPRDAFATLALLARSAAMIACGISLFLWAREEGLPFVADHLVKILAGYLMVLDGGIQLVTALVRVAGGRPIDGSIWPIFAVTPADFWRRYNRVAGQFFYEDVYKPFGGLRHNVRGVVAVFLINGALHEYLASMIVGRVRGYQMAFFALQGIAVIVTARLRPRGASAVLAWALTLAFNITTGALFFLSFQPAIAWYHCPP